MKQSAFTLRLAKGQLHTIAEIDADTLWVTRVAVFKGNTQISEMTRHWKGVCETNKLTPVQCLQHLRQKLAVYRWDAVAISGTAYKEEK